MAEEDEGVDVLDTDQEDETDEDTKPDDWTPPTKADWDKLVRRLNRANSEAKKAKEATESKPSDDDIDAQKEAVRKEEAERYKARIVRTEARSKLKDAGLKGDPAKLVKLISLEDIDLGDDDEIEGLDAEIDALKEDFPDLFESTKKKSDPRTRKDATDKAPSKTGESWEERMAKALRGGK